MFRGWGERKDKMSLLVKDILKGRVCARCNNSDTQSFVLYFVLEDGKMTNYVSCLNCGDIVGVEIRRIKAEKYVPDLNLGIAG